MPKIILDPRIQNLSLNSLLISGDLSYFMKYGLPLIGSFLKNSRRISLIINCVDFEMKMASNLIVKYFGAQALNQIFIVKTKLSVLGYITPERRLSYLKTIRFYVAQRIRAKADINLVITDIDALITKDIFDRQFEELSHGKISFAVGSTYDFLSHGLFNSSNQNYIWRVIKAGFTYFKRGNEGNEALSRVVSKLFNILDAIPPADDLKLYRAYYGDQLSLLFTALELGTSNQNKLHHVKCIGFNDNEIVSFGSNPHQGSMWIPPASRDETLLTLLRYLRND